MAEISDLNKVSQELYSKNYKDLTLDLKTQVKELIKKALKFAGKGKAFAATAAVGVGTGALVKQFRNDSRST